MTPGEQADQGSAVSVSGPHEWPPPEEGIARQAYASFGGQAGNHRTMKKSEKNRITDSAIFLALHYRLFSRLAREAAKLAGHRRRNCRNANTR